MTDPWSILSDLQTYLWQRLANGAALSDDPFRFVAFATNGARGPEARMVGLRRADRALAEVEVHSDLRTEKVAALRQDPRAALLFWDTDAQLQLRVEVAVDVVPADPVRWGRVPKVARGNYGTDPAPGTPMDDPSNLGRTPSAERFCALVGRVTRMDAVSLSHDPHRRAIFDAAAPEGRWVAP